MKEKLEATMPKVCRHFGRMKFVNILSELKKFDRKVESHFEQFKETQRVFSQIACYYAEKRNKVCP